MSFKEWMALAHLASLPDKKLTLPPVPNIRHYTSSEPTEEPEVNPKYLQRREKIKGPYQSMNKQYRVQTPSAPKHDSAPYPWNPFQYGTGSGWRILRKRVGD